MEAGIENIQFGDEKIAIIIRNSFSSDGIEFFTPNEYSQQLAYMNRPKNYIIPPHVHNVVPRDVQITQEVLFVRSGKLRVDLYDSQKIYIESRVLKEGDLILLASGGHGFKMLEDCEILEVKQGPYAGDMDKTRFDRDQNLNINVRGMHSD